MGIYYNLPPPNIGAQQPLTPKQLTPASGPTPSNPVFGVVSLVATLVAAWSATAAPLPPTAPHFIPPPIASNPPLRVQSTPQEVLGWWLPPVPLAPAAILLKPPISGPSPQAPPIQGGASIPGAVLTAWLPPAPQPPVAVLFNPPISGPAPQAPPVSGGAQVSAAALTWWIPPPAQPPSAILLAPPIAGPAPQAPPLLSRGQASAWYAQPDPLPQRALLSPALLTPSTVAGPPFLGAGSVEIEIWWARQDQPSIPRRLLTPPVSGPTPQAPPVQGGASVPEAVLVQWTPSPSVPPLTASPQPVSGPLPQVPPDIIRARAIEVSWSRPTFETPQRTILGGAPLVPAVSGPPPFAGLPAAIGAWWARADDALPSRSPASRVSGPVADPPPLRRDRNLAVIQIVWEASPTQNFYAVSSFIGEGANSNLLRRRWRSRAVARTSAPPAQSR